MEKPVKHLLISAQFPEADYSIPPLVRPDWADAIEETLFDISRDAPELGVVREIMGYPLSVARYEELTRKDRALAQEEASKFVEKRTSNSEESFVHANYNATTKDFVGLLVIEGELIAECGGFPDIASAKRKYQAYYGHYKAGFKTKEQLKDTLSVKDLKSGEI